MLSVFPLWLLPGQALTSSEIFFIILCLIPLAPLCFFPSFWLGLILILCLSLNFAPADLPYKSMSATPEQRRSQGAGGANVLGAIRTEGREFSSGQQSKLSVSKCCLIEEATHRTKGGEQHYHTNSYLLQQLLDTLNASVSDNQLLYLPSRAAPICQNASVCQSAAVATAV